MSVPLKTNTRFFVFKFKEIDTRAKGYNRAGGERKGIKYFDTSRELG